MSVMIILYISILKLDLHQYQLVFSTSEVYSGRGGVGGDGGVVVGIGHVTTWCTPTMARGRCPPGDIPTKGKVGFSTCELKCAVSPWQAEDYR